MNAAQLGVVAVALGLSVAVVLLARVRGTRTALDFQLAGRQMGVLTNACAICGDYVSAASFLGVAAAVYAAGLDGAWYATGFAAGFVPVLLFIATPLRRFGERSIPDFLARRFGSEAVRLVAVLVVELIILAYLIPQAVGGGLAWQLLSGASLPGLDPYGTGIVASTVLTALLVVIGGMRGTTWNQAIQFVVLVAVLVWLAAAMVSQGFSYSGALRDANETVLTRPVVDSAGAESLEVVTSQLDGEPALFGRPGARYGAIGHFALVVTLMAGTAGLPHVMNRFFTSPTGRAARMTTVWVLAFVGLFYTLAVMLGTAARSIIASKAADDPWLAELTVDGVLRVPEHALLSLGRLYGGDIGLSVVTTGALLAIMSTIGGLLLAASASWGHDIYERYLNPRATRAQALKAGQVAVGVVAVGAAMVAVGLDPSDVSASTPSVVAALVTAAFALAGSTLTPCLVLGIWWKRTTATAVIAGMVLGAVMSVGVVVTGLAGLGLAGAWQTPTIVIGPLVSVVIVVVSLLTTPVAGIDGIWVRLHGSANDRRSERLTRITLDTGVP